MILLWRLGYLMLLLWGWLLDEPVCLTDDLVCADALNISVNASGYELFFGEYANNFRQLFALLHLLQRVWIDPAVSCQYFATIQSLLHRLNSVLEFDLGRLEGGLGVIRVFVSILYYVACRVDGVSHFAENQSDALKTRGNQLVDKSSEEIANCTVVVDHIAQDSLNSFNWNSALIKFRRRPFFSSLTSPHNKSKKKIIEFYSFQKANWFMSRRADSKKS